MARGGFTGREAEVAELRRAWDEAEEAGLATVLVGGEAGAGKSTLVEQVVEGLRGPDVRVALGACLQVADGTLPFAPFVEAFRALVDDLGQDRVRRSVGGAATELSRLVPSLGRAEAGTTELDGSARIRLFDAALRLVAGAAEDARLLLVIEDLHWADPSTRELLGFLTRSVGRLPVLTLATFRTDELHREHPLLPFVAELSRTAQVRRLDVPPLGRPEIAALLEARHGRPPARATVDRILERSGGNAFFAEELIGAEEDGRLPPSLRDTLLARLAGLSAPTLQVLRVAAAAGREVHPVLLAEATSADPDEVDRAIREAVDRSLVVASADGDSYRFRHALIAEVVYGTLLPGERVRVHRALAELLESSPELATGAPAAEVAHHWSRARDQRRAFAASVDAAAEAERLHAFAEALGHVERLLELWEAVEEPATVVGSGRADVVARAAELAALSGRLHDAVTFAEHAVEELGPDAPPERAAVLLTRAAELSLMSAVGKGEQVDRALELTSDGGAPVARARALLVAARRGGTDSAGREARAAEALAVAREGGDAGLEASALAVLGESLARQGRREDALEALLEGIAVTDRHGLPDLRARLDQLHAATLIYDGRASEGGDVARAGLERARAAGLGALHGASLAGTATSGLFLGGRWSDADDLVAEMEGESWGTLFLATLQARLLAFRGQVERAREVLAVALGNDHSPSGKRPSVEMAIAVFSGDLDEAHRVATSGMLDTYRPHAGTINEAGAWALRVEADRVAAGDVQSDEVAELADRLLAGTVSPEAPMTVYAEAWRLTAVAEHARITATDATDAWRTALAAWETLGWPYPVAYARVRLAEAGCAAGRVAAAEAEDLLAAAHRVADGLGAVPLAEQTLGVARRVGVDLGVGRAGREDRPHGLTERELEVLELVAEGRSNREIGEALFISQKTASVHVSNLMRKLDVSSRTEAATLAVRRGLVPGGVDGR